MTGPIRTTFQGISGAIAGDKLLGKHPYSPERHLSFYPDKGTFTIMPGITIRQHSVLQAAVFIIPNPPRERRLIYVGDLANPVIGTKAHGKADRGANPADGAWTQAVCRLSRLRISYLLSKHPLSFCNVFIPPK